MRIAFDVSPLVRPHPPGVMRALAGTLDALEARGVIEVVRLAPAEGESLRRWRALRVADAARAAGALGVHSFVSALPRARGLPLVQTVHELPWRHGVRENADFRHRAWAAFGPRLAARVSVPSDWVRRDLLLHARCEPERVKLVPWGVGAPFSAQPDELDRAHLERWKLDPGGYVLCVGAARAKKSLAAVQQALADAALELAIVVTGELGPEFESQRELARRLGRARSLLAVGALDDRELAALYRAAAFVPVLSRSEGFAFPVLEAFACGAPVVVAAPSAQSELGGDVAIAVSLDEPASIARGFVAALAERDARRELALARAREFTWTRTAECVERLWSELA